MLCRYSAEWDVWYLCDDPTHLLYLPCVPCMCVKECTLDCCGCLAGNRAYPQPPTEEAMAAKKLLDKERGCMGNCCSLPMGRTANFFDMDIVADVGAHQSLSQLCINEGDLLIHRMAGRGCCISFPRGC
jgi:hypothetical protein